MKGVVKLFQGNSTVENCFFLLDKHLLQADGLSVGNSQSVLCHFLNFCLLPKQLYNHYSFAYDTLWIKAVTNSEIQIYTYAMLLSVFISAN